MGARRLVRVVSVLLCGLAGGLSWCSAPALAQREHAFGFSFGSAGSGNGQLARPGAMAVNESTHDVYVIDRENRRVEEFGSSGAYIGQFDGSASPTGQFAFTPVGIASGEEGAIAVDNSANPLDPSAGDVYVADTGHNVIDKFSASGVYIGQITGESPSLQFKGLSSDNSFASFSVAVAPDGAVWIRALAGLKETNFGLLEFSDAASNEFVGETAMRFTFTSSHKEIGTIGLAIDSEENLLLGQKAGTSPDFVAKFNSAGAALLEEIGGVEATGVGVDRTSNDVYAGGAGSVSAFTPSGELVESFGAGQIGSSEGIAVDSSTGTVYTSDAANGSVEAFTSFIVPDVSTGQASSVRETTATLNGTVNPDGLPLTSCEFEYGTSTSYGQAVECSPRFSELSGNAPVGVSANVSGLTGLTHYHFRLRVGNANGTNVSVDRSFLTPVPVTVSEEGISNVSAEAARFSAQVNPGGADTTFRFEYGPTTAYGLSVPLPEGDLGAGTSQEPVSVLAEGLAPQTTYHVRIAATNVLGTVYGPDETLTTQTPGGAFALPDERQWELVSPPNKYGAGIEPIPQEGVVQAAEDGSGITYIAGGPIVETSSGNPSPFWATQVLSKRAGGGWSTQDIASPNSTVDVSTPRSLEFPFFSSNLSLGLVEPPGSTPLSPEATERTVYVRDNSTGGYAPLVTAGNVPPGTKFGPENALEGVHAIIGTPDLKHAIVQSLRALTSNAASIDPTQPFTNIYEWSAGQLQLVSVLESGAAVQNGEGLGYRGINIRRALSSDGSRVFWSTGTEELYMRDTVAEKTVRVDAPEAGLPAPPTSNARFEIASANGSKVFFEDDQPLTAESKLTAGIVGPPDLYVYDTQAGTLKDLTVDSGGSELANVQNMVLGASEDGSVVYSSPPERWPAGHRPARTTCTWYLRQARSGRHRAS